MNTETHMSPTLEVVMHEYNKLFKCKYLMDQGSSNMKTIIYRRGAQRANHQFTKRACLAKFMYNLLNIIKIPYIRSGLMIQIHFLSLFI